MQTFCRRILHTSGFGQEDLERRTPIIYSNILEAMGAMVHAVFDWHLTFASDERNVRVGGAKRV